MVLANPSYFATGTTFILVHPISQNALSFLFLCSSMFFATSETFSLLHPTSQKVMRETPGVRSVPTLPVPVSKC